MEPGSLARGVARGVAVVERQALHPETRAVVEAMATPPSPSRAGLADGLVAALKVAGIWGRLDALYLMAAHDAQAACINWAAPSGPALTPVNSPAFHRDSGFQGDEATCWIETGLVQGSGRYQVDDHHAGVWVTDGQSTTTAWGNVRNRILPRTSAGVLGTRSNMTTSASGPASDGQGHSSLSRASPERYLVFRHGAAVGMFDIPAAPLVDHSFALLGYGEAAGVTHLSAWRLGAAHFGASLSETQMGVLHAALARYIEGLNPWT